MPLELGAAERVTDEHGPRLPAISGLRSLFFHDAKCVWACGSVQKRFVHECNQVVGFVVQAYDSVGIDRRTWNATSAKREGDIQPVE